MQWVKPDEESISKVTCASSFVEAVVGESVVGLVRHVVAPIIKVCCHLGFTHPTLTEKK